MSNNQLRLGVSDWRNCHPNSFASVDFDTQPGLQMKLDIRHGLSSNVDSLRRRLFNQMNTLSDQNIQFDGVQVQAPAFVWSSKKLANFLAQVRSEIDDNKELRISASSHYAIEALRDSAGDNDIIQQALDLSDDASLNKLIGTEWSKRICGAATELIVPASSTQDLVALASDLDTYEQHQNIFVRNVTSDDEMQYVLDAASDQFGSQHIVGVALVNRMSRFKAFRKHPLD